MVARVTAGWNTRLLFEPGRLIVGDAGVLLYPRRPGQTGRPPSRSLIVDAAMNDLMRPALYDACHRSKPSAFGVQPSSTSSVRSARPATPSPWAARWTGSEAGDLIVFRTAGAYGATLSNGYNRRPLAAEVLVDGDEWALIPRRVSPIRWRGWKRRTGAKQRC